MTSSSNHNFNDLNDLMAKTVAKIGLENAIQLLQKITNEKGIQANTGENIKLITFYLLSRCLAIFNLKEDQFYSSTIREYREARMACYHLLKKYTSSSYRHIAQQFQQKKRNVLYSCQKCDEVLSVPQFHRVFSGSYRMLESQTLDFIAKLNSTNGYENTKQ